MKQNPTSPKYKINVQHISMRASSPQQLAFGVEFLPRQLFVCFAAAFFFLFWVGGEGTMSNNPREEY